MSKRPFLVATLALCLLPGCLLPGLTTTAAATGSDVSTSAVLGHLRQLQDIAEANGGNRASGQPGYRASLDYIREQLDQAGFVTTVEEFDAPLSGRTFNLIAETRGGNADRVVMLGAHLDSVGDGPGINDNASGSAAILQSALALAGSGVEPKNKVRFAFWGAEEEGLVGSTHYVESLPAAERDRITMYLNFDMVGSPNPGYFTYDGDDSDGTGAGPGPEGSAQIEKLLNDAFAGAGVDTEGTDFDGRSDYGAFIEAGIPAGGIFTGAEEVKTAEQAQKWGGTAGRAFDPCYHQACDTIENVNREALERNLAVIDHAVETYAHQTPPWW